MPDIITLDIEASGIHPESYPIEVGVVLPDGESYCSLIKPAADWLHWDDRVHDIHGITREELRLNGKAPTEVAVQLNTMLAGQTVYSDCWVLDQPWLVKLYDTAAVAQQFKLVDMMYILGEAEYNRLNDVKKGMFDSANLQRHRATNDARILQMAYHSLINDNEASPRQQP